MSNKIKQLKDAKGQAFDPYTSVEALTASSVGGGNFLVTNNLGTGVEVSETGLNDIPTVPEISTDISADAESDTKTASPKAVKTYVDTICGNILTVLTSI